MSIPEIFETHGEPHFRDGEARVIARLLDGGPAVIATGGGAFMREETRNRIARQGGLDLAQGRRRHDHARVKRRADRPLLQTADPAATVGRLIEEREPVYQTRRPHDRLARRAAREDRRRMHRCPARPAVPATAPQPTSNA